MQSLNRPSSFIIVDFGWLIPQMRRKIFLKKGESVPPICYVDSMAWPCNLRLSKKKLQPFDCTTFLGSMKLHVVFELFKINASFKENTDLCLYDWKFYFNCGLKNYILIYG